MGEKRKRVEIENGHDEVYPLHNEALTRNGSTNNRTVVRSLRGWNREGCWRTPRPTAGAHPVPDEFIPGGAPTLLL